MGAMVEEAMASAAATLTKLIQQRITLSLDSVEFASPRRTVERLSAASGRGTAVAVRQRFFGSLGGEMLLVAPEDQSLELVRQVLHEHVPLTLFTELEQDAFLEIGNVMCNACLGLVTQKLNLPVQSSLPVFVRGSGADILGVCHSDGPRGWEVLMLAHVGMNLRREYVSGYLALVLDVGTAQRFIQALNSQAQQGERRESPPGLANAQEGRS